MAAEEIITAAVEVVIAAEAMAAAEVVMAAEVTAEVVTAAAAIAVDTEALVSMLSLATVTYVIPFPSSLPSYLLSVVLLM